MADSDVIKEFLVGLGFKVDQKGLKTFTGTIDGATKAVAGLVATIAGSALTVSAGVTAFASNLEGLYFASQRIGSTATSLKSAEYAARDLGASADQVRGSLEGMARFLRENPGGESFLQGIGVATRDANGNLKDTADLMVGLGAKLRAMPWYQAKQYANVLGIDDNTLRAITSGEFGRKLDENRKKLANSGMDQATKDAHAFMEGMRGLGLQFDAFAVQVEAALLKRLGPDMHGFADWFEKNGPMIADRVAEIAGDLVDMTREAGPYIEQIFDLFVRLDTATDGWSTKLIGVLLLARALGATSLIGSIARLAGSFVALGGGIAGVATAALLISGDTSDSSKAAQKVQNAAMAGSREAAIKLARTQLANNPLNWFRTITEEDVQKRADEIMAGEHAGMKDLPRGIRNNNPGNLNFANQQGATLEAGPNARFARFETMEQGVGALGRQLKLYESRGIDTIREIVNKYAPAGDGNNTEAYMQALSKALGVGVDAQLDLGNAEHLAALVRGIIRHENGGNYVAEAQIRAGLGMAPEKPEASVVSQAIGDAIEAAGRGLLDGFNLPGSDSAESLLSHLETAQRNAAQIGSQVERHYVTPAPAAGEAGSRTVQVTQKTDIHVHGTGDPNSTAQAVAGAQGRVVQDMTRNLNSAVN